MKRIIIISIAIIIMLSGVGWWLSPSELPLIQDAPTDSPLVDMRIIQNPPIESSNNITPLKELGCVEKDKNRIDCSAINLSERYGCEQALYTPQKIGELSPDASLLGCTFRNRSRNHILNETVFCLNRMYGNVITLANGTFHKISTKEEFREFFAPVDSAEEALSFATLLTRSSPRYEISVPDRFRTYVPTLETTYVEERDNGFLVHLFDSVHCGCPPKKDYYVDYLVEREGHVEKITKKKIYSDPRTDGMCVS